jgi:hypothetical protein
MSKYKNGKIYCIRSFQTEKVYVGSTVERLCQRMALHRHDCRRYLNGTRGKITSFDILKYDDAYIELIENYPCNSKEELHRKEGQYIRKMNCVNKNVAGRTKKEYDIDNKEKIKERKKQYAEQNKEKIKETKKKYEEANKEKIKERKKKYYQDNIETKKKYYQDNKERIAERKKKNIKCDVCNIEIRRDSMTRHKMTKKHLNNLK